MIESDSVRFGETTIEYRVRRSARRRKTVEIRVDGGGVCVAAPTTTPVSELRDMVRRRAAWILDQILNQEVRANTRPLFVSGEKLPYLGRSVRMIVRSGNAPTPTVRFDHWRFMVSAPGDLVGDERFDRIRDAFIEWYRDRAAERLGAGVERWWPKLGRGERQRILIRNQRRSWGSCAADGTLRFNWRLVMLHPALIEYIVVHELAHLTVRNHSADFWRLVEEVLPDVQLRRRQLREAERGLPL